MVIENNSTKKANSTASNSTTDATQLSLAELEKTDDKPLDAKKNATNSTDI